MDVSVLNSVAPDKALINRDLINPDSLGQPPQKNIPPPLTLHPTTVPLHPSPFTCLFNNLSTKLWEGAPLERSTDGYEPQSYLETFNLNQTSEEPESPLSCVSTYILLPQSDAK